MRTDSEVSINSITHLEKNLFGETGNRRVSSAFIDSDNLIIKNQS